MSSRKATSTPSSTRSTRRLDSDTRRTLLRVSLLERLQQLTEVARLSQVVRRRDAQLPERLRFAPQRARCLIQLA